MLKSNPVYLLYYNYLPALLPIIIYRLTSISYNIIILLVFYFLILLISIQPRSKAHRQTSSIQVQVIILLQFIEYVLKSYYYIVYIIQIKPFLIYLILKDPIFYLTSQDTGYIIFQVSLYILRQQQVLNLAQYYVSQRQL